MEVDSEVRFEKKNPHNNTIVCPRVHNSNAGMMGVTSRYPVPKTPGIAGTGTRSTEALVVPMPIYGKTMISGFLVPSVLLPKYQNRYKY
jgi:hypothetical protein